MPSIYGTIRVSSNPQVESGLGLDAQEARIAERYASLLARYPDLQRGKVYRDKAVSASRTAFRQRPESGKLFARLKRGDHLVIAKLDRAFRSTKDCLYTLDELRKRGVTVHILDIDIDTSTPMGQLMMTLLAAIAQWESQRLGERIKDALAERRKRAPDVAVTAQRVIGYAIDPEGRLSPHAEERRAGQIAADLRDAGQNFAAIAAELNRQGLRRPANPRGPKSQRAPDRPWTWNSVKLLVQRQRLNWPLKPSPDTR